MSKALHTKQGRGLERTFLLLGTLVLGLLFFELYKVHQEEYVGVAEKLERGTIVNLNDSDPANRIKKLLQDGFYFEDARDVALISETIKERLHNEDAPVENIGEINKRQYFVAAQTAFEKGGESFQKRVKLSRQLLGFSGADSARFNQELRSPPSLPATVDAGSGKGKINVTLRDAGGDLLPGVLIRLNLLLPQDSIDTEGRLQEQKSASLQISYITFKGNRKLQSLTAYARTDASGKASFVGLPEDKAYTVLPMQPNFQFGASQGVESLSGSETFSFVQAPHSIRLLATKDFNNLKKEGALIVRTPAEATRWFWIVATVFVIGFWLLHFVLSLRFATADQIILPLIFLLTGFSLVTLLSLQDGLRDRFLAHDTLFPLCTGIVGIGVLLLFDLRRFTVDSGFYRIGFFKENNTAANGWPWAALGAGLLLLTILFGSGPQGSGVKVNLFGFQPSEVVRFLMLLFLGGFFAVNETFIAGYATARKRWRYFSFAAGAIVFAILLFLALGDLGPAMVLCFTFIILFSFSRGDFADAIIAVVLYAVLVTLTKNAWLATGITALLLAIWFYFGKKGISESAVMALGVMALFLLLDQVPFLDQVLPGPVGRLADRKAIWQSPWNNEVYGGDQVANGIWAMSTGGVSGQGIGQGFAKTIPEAHTDMILPAFGEEMGWAGIICLLLIYLIYLHRSFVIGRQSGRPFLFYISAAIGISTFVQAMLIAGGSTGALPLSGVALPFMSYGGSSLVINMLAAGFLLSASVVRGSPVQMAHLQKTQDRNLLPALLAGFTGVILLSVVVSRYLFNNKRWVVEPALVADRSGARMYSYNPRIAILVNRLEAGTLYDRKGLVLATNKREEIVAQQDSLLGSGLQRHRLQQAMRQRQSRLYPFAEQMFFWTGDANTGVFSGGNNGYFGEYTHLSELRGFAAPTVKTETVASRYREHPLLPQETMEMQVSRRNYAALVPMLLAGPNSVQVDSFKAQNRNLQLTVDAALQTSIQQSLQQDSVLRKSRVSVVVMEDSTGDVLASALYPLPPVNDWELLTLSQREQALLPGWITTADLSFTHTTQPGSTAKLLTALAAFNKLGTAAAQKTFLIRQQDLVRATGDEPDETGNINMQRAIVKSNNPYFIRLANEAGLREEMATLYLQTGMFLKGVGGYFYNYDGGNSFAEESWRKLWRNTEFRSSERYDRNDIRKSRASGISGMAWGQGELVASPAAVARLASGIANGGYLVDNRYVLSIRDSLTSIKDSIQLAQKSEYTKLLTQYMKDQSAGKVAKLGLKVAGKTGTPERIWKGRRINDGWYVFFAPKASGSGHIVACIRIEDTRGSSIAVQVAGQHVIPQLLRLGYLKDGGFNADKF